MVNYVNKTYFKHDPNDFFMPLMAHIQKLIEPYILKEFKIKDKEWEEIFKKETGFKRLSFKAFVIRLFKFGRNARDQNIIKNTYDDHYQRWESVDSWLKDLEEMAIAIVWGSKQFLCSPQALRISHLEFIKKTISDIKPETVFEVGAGNFNLISSLSKFNSKITYYGLEKSLNGINLAKKNKYQKNIKIIHGDAKKIDLPDNSIDFTYTRLALEQMEEIRDEVMSEICRITKQFILLIEPWKNVNKLSYEKAYIRRMGYFNQDFFKLARKFNLNVVYATSDFPQKVPFKVAVVLLKK